MRKTVLCLTAICLWGVLGCSKKEDGFSIVSLYPKERYYDAVTAQADWTGSDDDVVRYGFTVSILDDSPTGAQPLDYAADEVTRGHFEGYVDGLEINTKYAVTPYAQKSDGQIVRGGEIRFITPNLRIERVTVQTAEEFDSSPNATGITSAEALLHGVVRFLGGSGQRVEAYGAYYWEKDDPQTVKKVTIEPAEDAPIAVGTVFSVPLSGLKPQTVYSVRIHAKNERRESLTAEFDFTTLSLNP